MFVFFFFQAEDGIRDFCLSRGLGDVYKRQVLTYNMNILQSIQSDQTFCVTLNDHDSVDQSKVIKKLSYDHPLFTVDAIAAQKRKQEISGINNTYYCGASWRNGFHEDGISSSIELAKKFGIKILWE